MDNNSKTILFYNKLSFMSDSFGSLLAIYNNFVRIFEELVK